MRTLITVTLTVKCVTLTTECNGYKAVITCCNWSEPWNKTTVFDETVLSTIFDTTVRKEYRLNQRAKIDPYRCPVVVGIVPFAADFRRFLTALVDLPPVTRCWFCNHQLWSQVKSVIIDDKISSSSSSLSSSSLSSSQQS